MKLRYLSLTVAAIIALAAMFAPSPPGPGQDNDLTTVFSSSSDTDADSVTVEAPAYSHVSAATVQEAWVKERTGQMVLNAERAVFRPIQQLAGHQRVELKPKITSMSLTVGIMAFKGLGPNHFARADV